MKKFSNERLAQLKADAFENIESYSDPDTPKALEQFTAQMKKVLLADVEMLSSVPEYLPVALYGKVKFSPQAKLQWAAWLKAGTVPSWDQFKTTVAFGNADLPLVKAVREYDELVLIEAVAVLYMLTFQAKVGAGFEAARDMADDEEEMDDRGYGPDPDDDDGEDEPGYDDAYDEIRFDREGR
ncbi:MULTISPECIES: cold adaptation protein AtcA [Rheinheimera]|uniref:DUF2267 domain-containing protein n=1 Tax=Rheinheimera marina TaxID=1774958 RepID=A0ABV9JHT1_9GAMM